MRVACSGKMGCRWSAVDPLEPRHLESEDCLRCGACCAPDEDWDRYVAVTDEEASVLPKRFRLRVLDGELGTEPRPGGVRCIALSGELGAEVGCMIYAQRPQACRAFLVNSEPCHEARASLRAYRDRGSK